MISFLLRRLLWMVLTLWIVYTFSFFLMLAVPGSPLSGERKLSPEVERNLRAAYGLNRPPWEQYGIGLGRLVTQFSFGPSFQLPDYTVNQVIAEGFPISASLGILALTFALCLGLTAGIVSAAWRRSLFDAPIMGLATAGIAIPNFVLASLAIILFVFMYKIFPAGGWGRLENLVLPALCLGAPFAAYIARLSRTGLLDVLGQDYIRTAYAKGLSPRTVIIRHALRGALLPVVSFLGPATAGVLTGSIVLERIFAIPGMGSHFIEAATQRDYGLALGMVMVYTVILYVMNTLVDLSYSLIDPRVKVE